MTIEKKKPETKQLTPSEWRAIEKRESEFPRYNKPKLQEETVFVCRELLDISKHVSQRIPDNDVVGIISDLKYLKGSIDEYLNRYRNVEGFETRGVTLEGYYYRSNT